MNRREALSRAALLLGTVITAPTMAAVMSGCRADPAPDAATGVLPHELEKLMGSLCDHILPRTSTPAATEAGVPAFINAVLKDCTPQDERDEFIEGLKQLDAEVKGFMSLDPDDQLAFLKKLDADAKAAGEKATLPQATWRKLKELTVVGYFTSETGATEVLEYLPVPGKYDGCIPLPEGQRAWAT